MDKKDYMRLPKERLAELLIEKDNEIKSLQLFLRNEGNESNSSAIPCYAPNGICTNPFRDCINCPKTRTTGFNTNSPQTQDNLWQQ